MSSVSDIKLIRTDTFFFFFFFFFFFPINTLFTNQKVLQSSVVKK